MKSLTRLSTTALLGLLAIAVSSSSIAGPGGGNGFGKGKGPRPKGPKVSLDLENLCTLDASNTNAPMLHISTRITDTTDDNGTGGGVIMSRTAQAAKKIRGNSFELIGEPQDLLKNSDDWDVWETTINLCDADSTVGSARALNSVVEVKVLNGDDTMTTFMTQCDDPFLPGDDLDGDGTDDVDQSDISIGNLGISCPTPQ